MAKKGRKNTASRPSVPGDAQGTASVRAETPVAVEVPAGPPVLCGAVSGVLYENIFKPALVSLGQRGDEEPLRALVESIATSIVMRASYEGCRRMDNIFQRYLYYLESRRAGSDGDPLQAQSLCDYWRCQTVITLFRDSGLIFDLLFPGGTAEKVAEARIPRNSLVSGLRGITGRCVGGPDCIPLEPLQSEVLNFVRGVSMPWSGFVPETVFGLLDGLPDDGEPVESEFSMLMPDHVENAVRIIREGIENTMLVDLVAAQHSRLFSEVTQAFGDCDCLPSGILDNLRKRVRFDRAYQSAFDAWTSGGTVSKPLHRSSRIHVAQMNAVGALLRVLSDASAQGLGVFLFHCSHCGNPHK